VPRAGLTADIVVDEAARLADEVGFEGLTLAAVAERFDVAVPSLYKHVEGLGALKRAIAVRAMAELGDVLAAATAGSAGNPLRALAHAYRGYARSHPGRYAATLRAPAPDDTEHSAVADAGLAVVFATLSTYGLNGDEAVDAARSLRAALHGFVSLETAGGFGFPRDVDQSFARLVDAIDVALQQWGSK